MKRAVILLILYVSIAVAMSFDSMAGTVAVYKIYHAEGPDSGYYLTAYTTCEDETDNCYTYYLMGARPYEGERLDVMFEVNEVEEFSNLSSAQLSRVKSRFKQWSGVGPYDGYECAYASDSSGRRELYIVNFALPNVWFFYNGNLHGAYLLQEE